MCLRRNELQKVFLIASVVLSGLSGLLSIPIITRGYESDVLALVSILILFNSLFGVFDVLRPVYVSWFFSRTKDLSIADLSVPPLLISAIGFFPFYICYELFLRKYVDFLGFWVVYLSFVFFLLCTGFWSVLDIKGHVGLSSLVKASGTSLVYVLFAFFAMFPFDFNLTFILLFPQFVILVVFFLLAYSYVGFKGFNLDCGFCRDSLFTVWQNLSKLIIDFSDRLFVSKFFGSDFIAMYNLGYDLSSRSNIPSQVITKFYYPRICEDISRVKEFLARGVMLSWVFFVLSASVFLFGEHLVGLYFGNISTGFFHIFVSLLVIFSMYSLAFFSQAAMRALGKYRKLTNVFFFFAVIGLIIIYPLFYFLGMAGVVIAALVMKMPGIIGYWYLRDHLASFDFSIGLLVFMQLVFISYVLFVS